MSQDSLDLKAGFSPINGRMKQRLIALAARCRGTSASSGTGALWSASSEEITRLMRRLMLCLAAFLLGLIAVAFYSIIVTRSLIGCVYVAVDQVKVDGPIYRNLVEGKDIIADVLPPPAYIIESYLEAHRLLETNSPNQLDEGIASLQQHYARYEHCQNYWRQTLEDSPVKTKLLVDSFQPADRFFKLVEQEFIPSMRAGDRKRAAALLNGPMKDAYSAHRKMIDEVVTLAELRNSEDEQKAQLLISQSSQNVSDLLETASKAIIGGAIGCTVVALIAGWIVWRMLQRYTAQLFAESADAIFIIDAKTKFTVDCNLSAEQLTGYSRKEITAIPATKLFSEESQKRYRGILKDTLNNQQIEPFEAELVAKNGEHIFVSVSAGSGVVGGRTYWIGIVRDISQQHRTEEEHARTLHRLENLRRLHESMLLPKPIEDKFKEIADTAVQFINVDLCHIWTLSSDASCDERCIHIQQKIERGSCPDEGKCLRLIAGTGPNDPACWQYDRIPLSTYPIAEILSDPAGHFIDNSLASLPLKPDFEWIVPLGLVSIAGYHLHDADGKTLGILAVFAKHPITEEDDAFLSNLAETTSHVILDDKIRQSHRDNEQYLQNIFNTVPASLLVIDSKTHTIVDANQAAENELGLMRNELVGHMCHQFICPSAVGKCPITDLNQKVDHAERICIRADGTRIPILKSVVPITRNGRSYLLECFVNISDQKLAEEERILASQRMESLLALNRMTDRPMQDIVATAVEDGIRLTGSQIGYLAMVSDDEANLTMQYWSKSAHQECLVTDKPLVYPMTSVGLWGEAVRQRKPIITNDYVAPNEHKRGLPQGHVPLTRHMNIPIFDGQKIVAIAGVGNKATDYDQRDVRQLQLLMDGWWQIVMRKRFEQQLIDARRQAEVANKAKSRFLASMSHEIRTPMTSILGYAHLLMEPDISSEDHKSYLSTIQRSGEHLLILINDILDLSKIEAGKMALEFERCSLSAILTDVANIIRPRAEDQGISFSIEYEGPVPETILTDGDRLRQAILNIAGNAIKFTEKGSVRIVVSFDPTLCNNQPSIKIDIIDTGIGIQKDVLPRLFHAFEQGDTSIPQRFGGTGLGLVISRHILHMLGGQLSVASQWRQGSTFTLMVPTGNLQDVPMLQAPAVTPKPYDATPATASREMLAGVRILLAEDGRDNQRLIKTILSRAGANVEIAENGRLAVDHASSGSFDLILMDMNMPEMDGYEATRLLREQGFSKPILALTANAMRGDSDKCIEAGCNDYLAKPIDRSLLLQTIQTHLGERLPMR